LELLQLTDGLYSKLVHRQVLAANLGLVDEMSNCDSHNPVSCHSVENSTSAPIPISKRSSENSACAVKLSVSSIVGSPGLNSSNNGSHASAKYGSIV